MAKCIEKGETLETLPLDEYKAICDTFDEGVYEAINLDVCVSQRKSAGGPAKENTLANVARLRSMMEE